MPCSLPYRRRYTEQTVAYAESHDQGAATHVHPEYDCHQETLPKQ